MLCSSIKFGSVLLLCCLIGLVFIVADMVLFLNIFKTRIQLSRKGLRDAL